jgi:hypothetical protein
MSVELRLCPYFALAQREILLAEARRQLGFSTLAGQGYDLLIVKWQCLVTNLFVSWKLAEILLQIMLVLDIEYFV